MQPVTIYTTRTCLYCMQAKKLIERYGITPTEYNVDTDVEKRMEMMERSGARSVPQIFIGEIHVGGYDDLEKLHDTGTLASLLTT